MANILELFANPAYQGLVGTIGTTAAIVALWPPKKIALRVD